jgi:CDP-diacylglycerol--glycerol-3-phosphate 3-phosphatidyltransferase
MKFKYMMEKRLLFFINALTFFRLPLALLFVVDNTIFRFTILFLAMFTDILDGYLARKYHLSSRFGAFIDPLMDKIFVFFLLTTLYLEFQISIPEILFFISRDFFLLLLFLVVTLVPLKGHCTWQSHRWGKCTTVVQFIFLLLLTAGYSIPFIFYIPFILLGYLTVKGSYTPPLDKEVPRSRSIRSSTVRKKG